VFLFKAETPGTVYGSWRPRQQSEEGAVLSQPSSASGWAVNISFWWFKWCEECFLCSFAVWLQLSG
jgi:hypothetical protein